MERTLNGGTIHREPECGVQIAELAVIGDKRQIEQVPYRLPEIVEAIATERGATSILRLVFFVIAHSVY